MEFAAYWKAIGDRGYIVTENEATNGVGVDVTTNPVGWDERLAEIEAQGGYDAS